MLRDLVAGGPQALQQEGPHVLAVVGVDEAQRVQRAALAASAGAGGAGCSDRV